MDKGDVLIIIDDFNLSFERRDRGRIIVEFCEQLLMHIANGQDTAEAWTFKSSIGEFYRLEYILYSQNYHSFDVSVNSHLDLGSDHRNVFALLKFIRSQESWKKQQISFKGWKSKLNIFWES